MEYWCENCGERFTAPYSSRGRKYCSQNCYHEVRDTTIVRECQYCGENFETRPCRTKAGNGKYCSKECFRAAGRERAWQECAYCGEKFKRKHKAQRFCSQECYWKWMDKTDSMKGENHPCWIEDRSKLKKQNRSYGLAYRKWRRKVYKRDNRTCVFDNEDCQGRIEAHHILPWRDYPKLRYKVNNGITVCHFHHPYKEEDEKRLVPFFQEMVGSQEKI